jgi:sugar lactone lactonase YvrE
MRPRSVKAHILRDYRLEGWEKEIAGRWSYRELASHEEWFKGWISFDTVAWNPYDQRLYCGLNSLDGDLLYRFNPCAQTFDSMNTGQWTDPFDVKIHRTLLLNPHDRCLYFATSLLHDLDQQHEAKGGKLVKFDPETGAFSLIAIPAEHLYIQSIAADWEREIIYAFTFPAEAVYRVNLASGESKLVAYLTNATMFVQPHNAVVDKEGWLWATCAETRAWDETVGREPVRLFKYHPEGDRFVWFDYGLSRKAERNQLLADPAVPEGIGSSLAETRHRDDFGFCDSMAYDGDRTIYAGTVAGVLARIDTASGKVEKVANVTATGRLPALAVKDGVLYGAGGMNGHTQLFRWDTRTDRIEGYTDLSDPARNEPPARVHDIAIDDEHRIYLAENDNHRRSSYLWEVHL